MRAVSRGLCLVSRAAKRCSLERPVMPLRRVKRLRLASALHGATWSCEARQRSRAKESLPLAIQLLQVNQLPSAKTLLRVRRSSLDWDRPSLHRLLSSRR